MRLGYLACLGIGLASLAGCESRLSEILTPQFFADDLHPAHSNPMSPEEAMESDGLSATFEAKPVATEIELRPDELIRSAEGVGDVEASERDKGRHLPDTIPAPSPPPSV